MPSWRYQRSTKFSDMQQPEGNGSGCIVSQKLFHLSHVTAFPCVPPLPRHQDMKSSYMEILFVVQNFNIALKKAVFAISFS